MPRTKKLTLVAAKKPQLRKRAKRDWSKAKACKFLSVLGETCNVSEACRRSRVPMTVAYRRRKMDAAFRAEWLQTIGEAYQRLELVLLDRAFNGTEKIITRKDGSEDRMREYSNQLGLALLKMHHDTAVEANSELPPDDIDEIRERLVRKLQRLKKRDEEQEARRAQLRGDAPREVVPASGELYANPAASQQMLDDAMFDVEKWLAHEIATEFARAEGAAFVSGNGTNQPLGFLASPNGATVDSARPMGTLQFLGTGAAGAFPATNPADKLIDLVQTLRSPYRQGAVFVMNSSTAAAIRKFKTADGAFMFQPSLAAGQPASLLGYPMIEAEDMPDIAANSLSIAFGNFNAGYVIAERNATTILRDPYTHKPYVHFYATKRIGGQVVNSEAIKLLKFA